MHILLVGRSFSGTKNYLVEHGHSYTVLQDKAATKYPNAKRPQRVVCDFSSTQHILEAAKAIHAHNPIQGVMATYESYILAASHIANLLQLPGIPIAAAQACTDKELMRSLFAQAPESISPEFKAVTNREELLDFATRHSFPLILKPANLAKSLLVTKSHNAQELLTNYDVMVDRIAQVYARYAPTRKPKIIIEEFLEGPVHSVDAFVDAHGEPHVLEQVVDYQTGYDIGFEDSFHYSRLLPSQLPYESIQAIRHTAAVGCRALGMKSSPAHVEIIYTATGPKIVEIGARNGGYRERMHALANGIDITGNALALVLDQPLDLTARRNDHCAVLELFPMQPGAYGGLSYQHELHKLSSLVYVDVKVEPGQHVGKSSEGYKMCAVIILSNADPDAFRHDLGFVNDNVHVITN